MLGERNISTDAMARHSKSLRLSSQLRFGSSSHAHCTNPKAKTKSKTSKMRLLGGQKKVGLLRKADGHKRFRRSKWASTAKAGDPEFVAEEQRIAKLWKELSPEEQSL